MTQLTRYNGHLARRQPPPQRRERGVAKATPYNRPERVRYPEDERDTVIIYVGVRRAIMLLALATVIAAVVLAALAWLWVMSLPPALWVR